MYSTGTTLGFLTLLLAAVSAAGQESGASPLLPAIVEPDREEVVLARGTVIDTQDKPIRHARIIARTHYVRSVGVDKRLVITDEKGRFEIRGPAAARSGELFVHVPNRPPINVRYRRPIEDPQVAEVDVTLDRYINSTVYLTLVDPDGEPAETGPADGVAERPVDPRPAGAAADV